MKTLHAVFGALAGVLFATEANAQPVVSFGSSLSGECYRNAADERRSNVSACDEALKQAHTSRDRKTILVNRGIIHKRNGDLQLALDDFNTAIEIDPNLAEAYLNRGSVYLLAGYPERAIEDYETSLELGAERPWAAWYNIGVAYEEMEKPERAREAFEKSLAENSRFAEARKKVKAYETASG